MKSNYEILSIRKLDEKNCLVEVKYDGYGKTYQYKRKLYVRRKFNLVVFDKKIYEFKFNMFDFCMKENIKCRGEVENEEKELPVIEAVEKEEPKEEVEVIDYDKEIFHKEYETIKTCIEEHLPVYLAGPAGSGKSHVLEQIAEKLDMNFYASNSVQQEFKLTGFIDAGGEYHETEFFKACNDDKECIFFIDELDASVPEVLVLLNTAIANGYFEFPIGRCDLKHVHFVAAGNTLGSGADEMYTGRMVIDQSTLDRFVTIEFDYDERVELHITKGNKELVNFIHELRKDAQEKGIRATFSYRCLTMVTKLEGKLDLEKVMKISVLKGMDKDTINTLSVRGFDRYSRAIRNIQMAA